MNSIPILFNRKILNRYLESYHTENIIDYQKKHEEILKWKKSVENSDLKRTKETSVQGLFLNSILAQVLGYSAMTGLSEWNQVAEIKSMLDGSEADCGLGFFSAAGKTVRAVVELKDAKINLDKKQSRKSHLTPVEQAFSYAHKNGSGACG